MAQTDAEREAAISRSRTKLTTKLKPQRRLPAGLAWMERLSRVDLIANQDRWWVDAKGEWHDVARIDPSYRLNLRNYLLRNAMRIRFCWEFSTTAHPYGAESDHLYDPAGDTEWMERQPLVRRLETLIGRDMMNDKGFPAGVAAFAITQAGVRFRLAFHAIHCRGQVPTPTRLNRYIRPNARRRMNHLNGPESSLRACLLERYGYTKDDATGRWHRDGQKP